MTDSLVPQLSQLIPGGGSAYLYEGDALEPEWQKVFYNDNYDRLLQVKRRYDLNSKFYARTAVDSEEWTEFMDGRLCRSLFRLKRTSIPAFGGRVTDILSKDVT